MKLCAQAFVMTCRRAPRSYAGRGRGRPGAGAPGAGISDSGILGFRGRILGARQSRAAGFSRDPGGARPRRRQSRLRDSGARSPDLENPRIRHRPPRRPGPSLQPGRRPWRPEGTGMRVGCVSRGSAPRSMSSPGLLGKPCLKTRKEPRSNGAHPCFVPFKLECSKDSGERRLAVCCFFRRVGPGLRPSRRDIGKPTTFRLSPQADSEVEPLFHLPPPPAFLRAEFATALLRPALKRLNLTQSAQSPCSARRAALPHGRPPPQDSGSGAKRASGEAAQRRRIGRLAS